MTQGLKFQLLPGQTGFIFTIHLKNTFTTVRCTEDGMEEINYRFLEVVAMYYGT
jgi:hypothetical protein